MNNNEHWEIANADEIPDTQETSSPVLAFIGATLAVAVSVFGMLYLFS